MKKPNSTAALNDFGRVRLSKNFFMREFLYSDIAAIHGFSNIPDNPDLAIQTGERLCQDLLEPLQEVFGRLAIRSGYRSKEVNGFGSKLQNMGKAGYSCGSNENNFAGHIWDERDKYGFAGASCSLIVPQVYDYFNKTGDWQKLAWWIHDNLPYSSQYYFPKFFAFNLNWHENPRRSIGSYIPPKGSLTNPKMANNVGDHKEEWAPLIEFFPKAENFKLA